MPRRLFSVENIRSNMAQVSFGVPSQRSTDPPHVQQQLKQKDDFIHLQAQTIENNNKLHELKLVTVQNESKMHLQSVQNESKMLLHQKDMTIASLRHEIEVLSQTPSAARGSNNMFEASSEKDAIIASQADENRRQANEIRRLQQTYADSHGFRFHTNEAMRQKDSIIHEYSRQVVLLKQENEHLKQAQTRYKV